MATQIDLYNGFGVDSKIEIVCNDAFSISATRLVMLKFLDDVRTFCNTSEPFKSYVLDADIVDESAQEQDPDND